MPSMVLDGLVSRWTQIKPVLHLDLLDGLAFFVQQPRRLPIDLTLWTKQTIWQKYPKYFDRVTNRDIITKQKKKTETKRKLTVRRSWSWSDSFPLLFLTILQPKQHSSWPNELYCALKKIHKWWTEPKYSNVKEGLNTRGHRVWIEREREPHERGLLASLWAAWSINRHVCTSKSLARAVLLKSRFSFILFLSLLFSIFSSSSSASSSSPPAANYQQHRLKT